MPFYKAARLHGVGILVLAGCLLSTSPTTQAAENQPAGVPTPAQIKALLEREPFTLETWPAWKQRLLAWMSDKSNRADPAYKAARDFMRRQAEMNGGQLPPALSNDALAWYTLGGALLSGDKPGEAAEAEKALRKSLDLDPKFARAHRNLAMALLAQSDGTNQTRLDEAEHELIAAKRIDASLELAWCQGHLARLQKRYGDAERLFRDARREMPDQMEPVYLLAQTIAFAPKRSGGYASGVKKLVDEFPGDGNLRCLYALALARDEKLRPAAAELTRARDLGVDPVQVIGPKSVKFIDENGAPTIFEIAGWAFGAFVGAYALIMALMAGTGLALGYFTRGTRALQLLAPSEPLVLVGQVTRTSGESWLAKLYVLALLLGIVLFYVAIPFVLVGLAIGTFLSIYVFFLIGRIPVKLVAIIAIVGLSMIWAVVKSLFAHAGKGSFGVRKTAAELPRLYHALAEVAARVETRPADEVYIGPGSSIGVHQEGRGPFGVFGVKKRVLTLGLSGLHVLTQDELKAILAHEYAHFSHGDTFYSRFIYRVTLSIEQALQGMAAAGGKLNYINPFYWFLVLYHKAYSLLAAGFSRSREFLADRMAASLYGSDVFTSALTNVATHGSFFERSAFENVAEALKQEKEAGNIYDAVDRLQESEDATQKTRKLFENLLTEKTSVYASHPSYKERVEALEGFPRAGKQAEASAVELFEDPHAIEQELTVFLTSYIQYLQYAQRLQAAAAARG